MTDRKFLTSLSKLGFPLFEPDEDVDVNETLAEVVKSNDTRLWEGFPVLLANAEESYQFSLERVELQLTTMDQKDRLHCLILLSGSIYSLYHLSFPWWNRFKKDLSQKDKASLRKQKELFKKKLKGLPLTKTEQEYYSRRVKKKVVALANSELHRLSKKLLEL